MLKRNVSAEHRALISIISYMRASKDHQQYCKILVCKVFPMLDLICVKLFAQWDAHKKQYLSEFESLSKKGLEELRSASIGLELKANEKGLLGNEKVASSFRSLMNCLSGEDLYVIPSYADRVYGCFKDVCYTLIDLGHMDLVEPYANIVFVDKYDDTQEKVYRCQDCRYVERFPQWKDISHCSNCHGADVFPFSRSIIVKKPYISSFEVAPSYFKALAICDLLNKGFSDDLDDPFSAYILLGSFCWAWKLDRYYFRDKNLKYNSVKNREKAAKYLNRHAMRCEAMAIAKGGGANVWLMTRERLDQNLELVLLAIDPKLTAIKSNKVPYLVVRALELCLEDDLNLRLKLFWTDDVMEVLHLHRFTEPADDELNSMEPVIFDFIQRLLEAPEELVEIGEIIGANAKKFLNRVKIDKILFKLFVKNHSEWTVTLEGTRTSGGIRISLKKERMQQQAVFNYIKRLETVAWQKGNNRINL